MYRKSGHIRKVKAGKRTAVRAHTVHKHGAAPRRKSAIQGLLPTHVRDMVRQMEAVMPPEDNFGPSVGGGHSVSMQFQVPVGKQARVREIRISKGMYN